MRKRRSDVPDFCDPAPSNEPEFDALSKRVIGIAIDVHKHLGPGLRESIYEECLALEFDRAGLRYVRQARAPIVYKGEPIDGIVIADFVIEDVLCLECKAIDYLMPVHRAQLHTYLKMFRLEIGLLLNFNTFHLSEGIRRVTLHEGY